MMFFMLDIAAMRLNSFKYIVLFQPPNSSDKIIV